MSSDRQAAPRLTPDTVFFVGNGALRVAPSDLPDAKDRNFLSPSWSEYMESLWSFIALPEHSPGFLTLEDFSGLPAPRQAEWFDREFQAFGGSGVDVAALRLHLLGRALHRSSRILTNPLLQHLAELIVRAAARSESRLRRIDVITTNVDCALEQNIAWAFEREMDSALERSGDRPRLSIESIVNFRLSARWSVPAATPGREVLVRVWKLHGCLRELKVSLALDAEMTRTVLSRTGGDAGVLCGHVPTDELGTNLAGPWRQTYELAKGQPRPRQAGVFSQTEYFRNMLLLARGEFTADSSVGLGIDDEQAHRLTEFRELMTWRALIFVGYGIPEVDVDVIYALQQYRDRQNPPPRWQLVARRELSAGAIERLRQIGVEPWAFDVANVGFAAGPGRLRSARRHEWRLTANDPLGLPPGRDWRRALERTAAQAWLEPQLQALRSLDPDLPALTTNGAPGGSRLVVAGLASVWHGIALTKSADFPTPRRVSAQLIAVDAQVPGGSGLVPVMVAAAAAGPAQVGSIEFFSNAPREWANWEEIEDMCLSAGVSVHPWSPRASTVAGDVLPVGRTSHVILFDPARDDARSRQPRQRFIMDVHGLANDAMSAQVTDWSKLKVPSATVPETFQGSAGEDFLFTDKECDPHVLADWKGPTVYETGASGDELVTRLGALGVKPTIWTAGVGSFLRTLVALGGRIPGEAAYARGPQGVLEHIEADSRLAALASCGELRERYLAKLVSFQRPGIWDHGGIEGFTYNDELEYGIWLRDRWPALAGPISELLGPDASGVLSQAHPKVGGGVLATVHEAGLMAVWRWPDGRTEHIAVAVETTHPGHDAGIIAVRCEASRAVGQAALPPICIYVSRYEICVETAGRKEILGPSDPIRRNTLAAGDTVRGAMAFGLWSAAYRSSRPADIRKILLASAALASIKCYAGSFVDFLRLLERMRGTPVWRLMWE